MNASKSTPLHLRAASLIKLLGALLVFASVGFCLWMLGVELMGGGEWTDIPLIFGLTMTGLVPGLLLYFTARSVKRYGASYGAGLVGMLFSLPILALAGTILGYLGGPLYVPAIMIVVACLCLFWAVVVLVRAYKAKA